MLFIFDTEGWSPVNGDDSGEDEVMGGRWLFEGKWALPTLFIRLHLVVGREWWWELGDETMHRGNTDARWFQIASGGRHVKPWTHKINRG